MTAGRQGDGRRAGAPARDAGNTVGRVAHQGQPVGDRCRRDAVLLLDTGVVDDKSPTTVDEHDALILDALGQVLVGATDQHASDALVFSVKRGCRGQCVVRLEFDHRPDDEAQRSGHLLSQLELCKQVGVDAFPRLVTVEQLVAKGLDDMVEGHADVGGPLVGHQAEQRASQRDRGADLPSVWSLLLRRAVIRPEQFVGTVDDVDLHTWDGTRTSTWTRTGGRDIFVAAARIPGARTGAA